MYPFTGVDEYTALTVKPSPSDLTDSSVAFLRFKVYIPLASFSATVSSFVVSPSVSDVFATGVFASVPELLPVWAFSLDGVLVPVPELGCSVAGVFCSPDPSGLFSTAGGVPVSEVAGDVCPEVLLFPSPSVELNNE